ncbi:MAG TPA: sugar ABC transporter permease, partial [Acidimicrobiales bacterium]|nr:sugar ABC transporter permease [Acidimicrobiales bacterium]
MTQVAETPQASRRAVPGPTPQRVSPLTGRHGHFQRRRDRRGVWFVLPFMVIFFMFLVVPLAYSVYTSLFTQRMIGGTVFTGLANYREALTAGAFWTGMARTLLFAAIQVPVMILVATFFAAMFELGVARFAGFFRAIFFLPFAVPAVVATSMWGSMLQTRVGAITRVFADLGLPNPNFFGPGHLLGVIVLIAIWEWTGYTIIILYTALKSVPREVTESAIVDGATFGRIVTRIKLPIIRPAIILVIIINVIGALQLFTEPYLLMPIAPNIS